MTLYTTTQAAALRNYARSTITKRILRGATKAVLIDGHYYIEEEDLPPALPGEKDESTIKTRLERDDRAARFLTAALTAVLAHTHYTRGQILGRNRDRYIVQERMILVTVLSHLGASPSVIGRLLDRNHSTIVHSLAVMAQPEKRPLWESVLAEAKMRLHNAEGCPHPVGGFDPTALAKRLPEGVPVTPVVTYLHALLVGTHACDTMTMYTGLWLLTSHWRLWELVEEVLRTTNRPGQAERIRAHAAALGLRFAGEQWLAGAS